MGKNPHISSLLLLVLLSRTKGIVISTEAAHVFVSSAAEKSASLPFRFPVNKKQPPKSRKKSTHPSSRSNILLT
jgi:hypothetical protein